jgi:hypothetical protein
MAEGDTWAVVVNMDLHLEVGNRNADVVGNENNRNHTHSSVVEGVHVVVVVE